MTVLITGGTGFVGLNVARALLERDADVVLLGHAPLPDAAAAALGGRATAVVGDVRRADDLARVLAERRPSRIVHAAALTPGPGRERPDGRATVEVNVLGTLNLLEAARERGIERLVLVSSGAVYGQSGSERPRLDEATPPAPLGLYGISKLAGEQLGLRLGELFGLDVVACRLGSVFGPFERASGVRETLSPILQVTRLAERGGTAILPRAGRRDWIYSRDVGAAIATLLFAPAPAARLYNVGSGVSWSVEDWCARLRAAFPRFDYRLAATPAEANVDYWGDRDRAPFAIDRLVGDLGFRARFGLNEAFADYLDWLRSQPRSLGGLRD